MLVIPLLLFATFVGIAMLAFFGLPPLSVIALGVVAVAFAKILADLMRARTEEETSDRRIIK